MKLEVHHCYDGYTYFGSIYIGIHSLEEIFHRGISFFFLKATTNCWTVHYFSFFFFCALHLWIQPVLDLTFDRVDGRNLTVITH